MPDQYRSIRLTRVSTLFIFLIAFILFYAENLEFSGVKIALVWKSILIYGTFLVLLTKDWRAPAASFWGVLYAAFIAINPMSIDTPIEVASEGLKFSVLPIALWAFVSLNKEDNKVERIFLLLIYASIFVVLSTTPFLLGVLRPLVSGYDLSIMGVERSGFTGFFANSHSASIVLAFAVLYITFAGLKGKIRWYLALPFIVLGCAVIILTYARVGYLMLAVSGALMLLITRYKNKSLIIASAGTVSTAAFLWLFLTSEVFRMRILGTNLYAQGSEIGFLSGREHFWSTALNNFFNLELVYQFYGLGSSRAMDEMQKIVGLRVYAHNGFIDVLQFSGYIGVAIFAMFFIAICKITFSGRKSTYAPLVICSFTAYLVQMMFQGERVFIADIMFAATLALHGMVAWNDKMAASPSERRSSDEWAGNTAHS